LKAYGKRNYEIPFCRDVLVSGNGNRVLNIAEWGLSEGWKDEVLKMCDVLIKSHDWRSVVNEKEINAWEERRIGWVYQEEVEAKRNNMRSDTSSCLEFLRNKYQLNLEGAPVCSFVIHFISSERALWIFF
jgi:hypothetical protein